MVMNWGQNQVTMEFVRNDEFWSESVDDDGEAAPSEHSDKEEMQAREEH